MSWLTELPYWREVALAGWLMGVGFGLFTRVSWRRLVFLGPLIIVVLSYFVRGLYCSKWERAEGTCSGGPWAVVAVAAWEVGLLLAASIRVAPAAVSWFREPRSRLRRDT